MIVFDSTTIAALVIILVVVKCNYYYNIISFHFICVKECKTLAKLDVFEYFCDRFHTFTVYWLFKVSNSADYNL